MTCNNHFHDTIIEKGIDAKFPNKHLIGVTFETESAPLRFYKCKKKKKRLARCIKKLPFAPTRFHKYYSLSKNIKKIHKHI